MITKLASINSSFRRRQRQLSALQQLSDNRLADIDLMRSDLDGFVRRRVRLG